MIDEIEFTATSESIYEYLFLLSQEEAKNNLKLNELESLVDTLHYYTNLFEINYTKKLEELTSWLKEY